MCLWCFVQYGSWAKDIELFTITGGQSRLIKDSALGTDCVVLGSERARQAGPLANERSPRSPCSLVAVSGLAAVTHEHCESAAKDGGLSKKGSEAISGRDQAHFWF